MPKDTPVRIRIPQDLQRRVDEAASSSGIDPAEVVRRAVQADLGGLPKVKKQKGAPGKPGRPS